MRLEQEVDYCEQRFIQIDTNLSDERFCIKPDTKYYIRQIRPHWYSTWKTVVRKDNNSVVIFSEDEIKTLWHGNRYMTVSIGDGTNAWKWTDYALK